MKTNKLKYKITDAISKKILLQTYSEEKILKYTQNLHIKNINSLGYKNENSLILTTSDCIKYIDKYCPNLKIRIIDMSVSNIEVLSCPFCGSTDIHIIQNAMFYIECGNCNCMTTGHATIEENVLTWNKRTKLETKTKLIINDEKI